MKWLKDNWLIVVLVAGLAFMAWNQKNSGSLYDKLMASYNQQNIAHQVQIKELERVNVEWRQKQDELTSQHHLQLQALEAKFQESLKGITVKQQVHRRRLVVEAKKNPHILVEEIGRIYGIPIYTPSGEQK